MCMDQTETFSKLQRPTGKFTQTNDYKVVRIVYLDEFLVPKADISYCVPQYNAVFLRMGLHIG